MFDIVVGGVIFICEWVATICSAVDRWGIAIAIGTVLRSMSIGQSFIKLTVFFLWLLVCWLVWIVWSVWCIILLFTIAIALTGISSTTGLLLSVALTSLGAAAFFALSIAVAVTFTATRRLSVFIFTIWLGIILDWSVLALWIDIDRIIRWWSVLDLDASAFWVWLVGVVGALVIVVAWKLVFRLVSVLFGGNVTRVLCLRVSIVLWLFVTNVIIWS